MLGVMSNPLMTYGVALDEVVLVFWTVVLWWNEVLVEGFYNRTRWSSKYGGHSVTTFKFFFFFRNILLPPFFPLFPVLLPPTSSSGSGTGTPPLPLPPSTIHTSPAPEHCRCGYLHPPLVKTVMVPNVNKSQLTSIIHQQWIHQSWWYDYRRPIYSNVTKI